MAVSNINCIHWFGIPNRRHRVLIRDHPKLVTLSTLAATASGARELLFPAMPQDQHVLDVLLKPAGDGVYCFDLANAVIFLRRSGELMFFDTFAIICIN